MELTIEQGCPSCGAAIVVHEDDKLIICDFCDVANFRVETTAARYILPYILPPEIEEDEVFFIPYLRFKGSVYFIENEQVRYKIVDTTRLAVDMPSLPPSLGLRPQVMKVRPVTTAVQGRFILQTVPAKAAFLQATRLVELFSGKNAKTVLHRAFIGETISVIYQPCFVKRKINRVIDAVDRRELGAAETVISREGKSSPGKRSWEPRFIGTLCPGCGNPLKGERDSRVLNCNNCSSYWAGSKDRLTRLEWSVAEKTVAGSTYFPFWKICFQASNYPLTRFADLIAFTNQPVVIPEQLKNRPLFFIVPAFKINPKMYLQLASQLTMAQNKIPPGKNMKMSSNHPVTLDEREAVQSLKSVLAHLTVGKKTTLQYLPELKLKVEKSELYFLPFAKSVHDYMQNHTPASIQVAAVRYGRSL